MGGGNFVCCCHLLWACVHALVGLQAQNPKQNKTVTRSLSLKHLQPLNKGPPLKFGYPCLRIN
ncbi:mCG147142 [Mus musculus]|nr:mCG147142 [Mus musculus]